MPIYEYFCRDCNRDFELLIRGNEKPACPTCGRGKLVKKFSVVAAHSAGNTPASCPSGDAGTCGMPRCGGGGCGMMG